MMKSRMVYQSSKSARTAKQVMNNKTVKKTRRVVDRFLYEFKEDNVGAYAAQAAFFVIISVFPLIMLLLTLIRFLPYFDNGVPMIQISIFPHDLNVFVTDALEEIVNKSSNAVLSISAVTALWSASKGVYSIFQGLSSVYSVKDTRGWLNMRLRAVVYTLFFLVMLILALFFLVFGNGIYQAVFNFLPLAADKVEIVSRGIKWLLGFAVLVLFFEVIYIAVPDRRSSVFEELPGALVSAVGWVGFSYLYSFYIEHFGHYANVYGSLTAVVLLMLWLYFCMYIMLFGAEVNVVWNDTYKRIAARILRATKQKVRKKAPKLHKK
ncbi:MAG: YihY/virulence factor BrkB family protein [Clostridia bacterium]|nr:YihY/virulence factor BrkB family protein [Clostridia bacterium]